MKMSEKVAKAAAIAVRLHKEEGYSMGDAIYRAVRRFWVGRQIKEGMSLVGKELRSTPVKS